LRAGRSGAMRFDPRCIARQVGRAVRSWDHLVSGLDELRGTHSPAGPASTGCKTWDVTKQDVDDYLSRLEPEKRETLEALRRSILAVVPDAEQALSYGVPAFRVQGKLVVGFSAARQHLSYLPHSGTVLAELADEVSDYRTSKGALTFDISTPLPDPLVAMLVRARLRELGISQP
jgi:uncharacterized protein YdhG (YjbR/CyaY superfamily)